jgi:hypothetical protein
MVAFDETGDVLLMKGALFAPDTPAVVHRSPPIEGTGQRRIVLILSTAAGLRPSA